VYSDTITFDKLLSKYTEDSRDFSSADLDPLIDIRKMSFWIFKYILIVERGESISRVWPLPTIQLFIIVEISRVLMLRCTQPAQIRQSPLTELNVADVLLKVDAADAVV